LITVETLRTDSYDIIIGDGDSAEGCEGLYLDHSCTTENQDSHLASSRQLFDVNMINLESATTILVKKAANVNSRIMRSIMVNAMIFDMSVVDLLNCCLTCAGKIPKTWVFIFDLQLSRTSFVDQQIEDIVA
jgi:hypothetical protein